jgi:hypothetical protein
MHTGDIGRERVIREKDGNGFVEGGAKSGLRLIFYTGYMARGPRGEAYPPDQADLFDSLVMCRNFSCRFAMDGKPVFPSLFLYFPDI